VVICRSPVLAKADFLHRRPDLEGATGIVVELPVHPSTWIGVRLNNEILETVMVRSCNLKMMFVGEGVCTTVPLMTSRTRKRKLIQSMRTGTTVDVISHSRHNPLGGFPCRAQVVDPLPSGQQ